MDDRDVIISSTEIIKDRLYFATLKAGYKPKPTRNSKYFHIEDEIVYESFYFDFGPYHLCHLYQFCKKLNAELDKNPRKKIVFYSSDNETLRLNAAYLIGCYQIIYLNGSPDTVYKQLTEGSEWSLLDFRDASGGPPLFDLSLEDVLRGMKVAHDAKFFDFQHFDAEQYLFYEKVENGDLNWIVPGKMLAFSGPHHRSRLDRGYPLHSPEHYHQYFRTHHVTTIVRLNKKSYDARQFTAHGFEHRELFFIDGSVPTDAIVNRFLRISEAAKGAVAVHCKAGLGRTGTLIACYMMKHHGFGSREAIAWLRVCRPGSVIGHQQWFLDKQMARMHAEGEAYRRRHKITSLPVFTRGIYCTLPPEPTPEPEEKPVSLQTILSSKSSKLDNANALNANERDYENNVTNVLDKYNVLSTKAPLTCKIGYTSPKMTYTSPKLGYNSPTLGYTNSSSSVRNNNASIKPQTRLLNGNKTFAKTSTFPPTRTASTQPKLNNGKPFVGKGSFHGQRANLARTGAPGASVTSTLSALTENCHLNGRTRLPPDASPKNQPKTTNITARKKLLSSNPNSRKKLPKSTIKSNLDSQELSSSDTNINISTDSLEAPFRFRRKRDKSNSPEPMDCISNSVITADVTPDNFEETTNSQGNKLYKIKALRKKCPAFGVTMLKKDGVQTRASSCTGNSTVKKK